MRSGTCSARATWARRTAGSDSSCWPTATAQSYGTQKGLNPGAQYRPSLATLARQDWPTPRASENENRQTKATPSQLAGEHGWSLGAAVNHWPMPNSAKAGNDTTLTCSGDGRETPNKLGWAVAIEPGSAWPTPMASDFKSRGGSAGWEGSDLVSTVAATFDPVRNVALNPAWVCRLMGFPDGWTLTSGPRDAAKRSTPASPRARRRA